MLIRGMAWRVQEVALGGLGKLELRKLTVLAKGASEQRSAEGTIDGGALDRAGSSKGAAANVANTAIFLREGNRLVREWNGTTHTVIVLAEGFEWQGSHYRSLSQIAEAITGAHWSGPRFFGLTKRKPDSKVAASNVSKYREPDRIARSATVMAS